MRPELLLYLDPSTAGSRVAAVTDDPALLHEWLGPRALTGLQSIPASGPTGPALARCPALLLRTVDERAVELARHLRWDAVERGSVLLLRGLARRPLAMELLEALAAAGLEPTTSHRRQLTIFEGVELHLARPTRNVLTSLESAHRLATVGRGLFTAPVQAPRVAVHGIDAAWVEDLDNVHAIAPGWADDPPLLREASPTVALVDHTQLDGPLTGALEALRAFGGAVVSDRPSPHAVFGPAATLEGLPTPVPNRVFAVHQLYASQRGTEPRSPSPAEIAAPDRLLALAAAGVPLAGTSELTADSDLNVKALGTGLSGLLARPLNELEHPTARDLHQVRLRRAAFDVAGTASVWPRIGARLGRTLMPAPRVLVVVISSAAEATERLVADVRRQRHRALGLLLVGTPPDEFAARPPTAGQGVARPAATSADIVAYARRVGADLVTLFEEGHRYGPEHLGDLARAMRLTGADVLLRPTEFVVDPVTATIGRVELPAVERSTRDPEVAAIAARTEDLAVIDQRSPVATLTSPGLASALLELGARAYLTHGFGLLRDRPAPGVTTSVADHLLPDLELPELMA